MPSIDQIIAQDTQSEIERAIERALSAYATPAVEYLNTKQAARYVGLSPEYLEIARHKADGSGPEYVKLPRAVRYSRASLDLWMQSHCTGNEPPVKTSRRAKIGA